MPINVKSPFKATFCIQSNQFFLINIKRNHLESGQNMFVKIYLFNWGKEGGFPPREHYGIPQINILGENYVRKNTNGLFSPTNKLFKLVQKKTCCVPSF